MAASNCETTRCGLCKFYNHEGRRGGQCSQLSVPVNACWEACCLSAAPFVDNVNSPRHQSGIAEWLAAPQQIGPVTRPTKPAKQVICAAIAS